MMAMVTNGFGCLPVLVFLLTLSSSVTSRPLRMKREISHNVTSINTNDTRSTATVAEVENARSTTVETLKASSTLQTVEVKTLKPDLKVSASTDYLHTPDLNHTQQNYSAGTENLTVHRPTDNESTFHTQLPKINISTGHISHAGSSAPTFPASLKPSKVTEKHMTAATRRMSTDAKGHTTEVTSTATKKSTTAMPHSCSTASSQGDGLVSRCLIAIASMAALTTIFIISTICLATKLSGYRYRHKAQLLQETEMVCISALMNDTDHPVPKPRRHPKGNGALIPNTEDGDPDGDNLTLNSFLPDTEGPL
ncbi:P-selectin glycoprotein ligand 1-like [Sinocyclocheilus rhinocerous]|uniref:P-selectin glycoprotein ligand 1-like n=1 Tax=Sinocyclocheilus rhinocerous TaxID=307959 RepID=A0A673GWA3_9TELE|nr:PREDICTED: P-selectin glycoprotein ligand 1-like [Sinocyclocheilus rhinocerous]